MVIHEKRCCNCEYCIGKECPNMNVPIHYCDDCGTQKQCYKFDGQELCIDCIAKRLEKV